MDAKIIAEGGFNTGRLYTRHGQRVYWWWIEGAAGDVIYFYDVDRMCDAYIKPRPGMERGQVPPGWLMACYDGGSFDRFDESRFDQGARERIPDDFDFGPALKI